MESPVVAQTVKSVTDAQGNVGFRVQEEGGFLAPGEFGRGIIPADGAGTRLMWYPAKAAFRAAVAMGRGATASAGQALALGYRDTAEGLRAAAFGDMTTASGNFATALGLHTTARATVSLALGRRTVRGGAPGSGRARDSLLVVGNGSGPSTSFAGETGGASTRSAPPVIIHCSR